MKPFAGARSKPPRSGLYLLVSLIPGRRGFQDPCKYSNTLLDHAADTSALLQLYMYRIPIIILKKLGRGINILLKSLILLYFWVNLTLTVGFSGVIPCGQVLPYIDHTHTSQSGSRIQHYNRPSKAFAILLLFEPTKSYGPLPAKDLCQKPFFVALEE